MKNYFKLIIYNLLNLFKKDYYVGNKAILCQTKKIKIGKCSNIQDYVIIRPNNQNIIIGEYCQIGPFTVIYGGSEIHIGNNVMIGPHCTLSAGSHDYKQTLKPMRFAGNLSKGSIIIEDNVWIGGNCTILDGVTIGIESVIGANSLVNKNIPPYSIAAGSPVKILNNRKHK
jgi:acetyltransferase-like isoleucine patch superfamily enzyme